MRILKLTKDSQKNILESLLKRSPNNYTEYESTVNEIINNVKENRDKAVFEYTKKFDKADVDASNIRVTEEEIKEAYELVDEKLLAVIKKALVNIRKYHEKQLQNSWFTTEDGIILGQKVTPIAKGRFSFRLTAPYSEKRREAARRYARENNAADRLN